MLCGGWRAARARPAGVAEAYVRAALAPLPRGAVLLTQGDTPMFVARYLIQARRAHRPRPRPRVRNCPRGTPGPRRPPAPARDRLRACGRTCSSSKRTCSQATGTRGRGSWHAPPHPPPPLPRPLPRPLLPPHPAPARPARRCAPSCAPRSCQPPRCACRRCSALSSAATQGRRCGPAPHSLPLPCDARTRRPAAAREPGPAAQCGAAEAGVRSARPQGARARAARALRAGTVWSLQAGAARARARRQGVAPRPRGERPRVACKRRSWAPIRLGAGRRRRRWRRRRRVQSGAARSIGLPRRAGMGGRCVPRARPAAAVHAQRATRAKSSASPIRVTQIVAVCELAPPNAGLRFRHGLRV
jgi:hypothetical protein